MALAYISLEKAQKILSRMDGYSRDTLPDPEDLTELLESIETRIDGWLGYRIAPTEYLSRLPSNEEGLITLPNYPVISIQRIRRSPFVVGPNNEIFSHDLTSFRWQGGRLIAVFGLGNYEVTYTAGFDPLPKEVSECAIALLQKTASAAAADTLPGATTNFAALSNLTFLEEPTRDLVDVKLPGGISQSFKFGNESHHKSGSKAGSGGGGTILDRLLAPLSRYRRKIRT